MIPLEKCKDDLPRSAENLIRKNKGLNQYRKNDQAQSVSGQARSYPEPTHDTQSLNPEKRHSHSLKKANPDFSSSKSWLMRGEKQFHQDRRDLIEPSKMSKKKKLVIKNLPLDIAEEDLRILLRGYGEIEGIEFAPADGDGEKSRMAYVSFLLINPKKELPNIIQDQKAPHFEWLSLGLEMNRDDVEKDEHSTKRKKVARRRPGGKKKYKRIQKARKKHQEEHEDVYISKRAFKRNIFGSRAKVDHHNRPTRIIKNFKQGHFTKPGQHEYHSEMRNEYCEDETNYYFREEEESAVRGRYMSLLDGFGRTSNHSYQTF